ncbi:ribonuclease HI family protein [Patescibacteria group bacterium]|nr:ribonuclease HI family protein [Patescibacteria group bacterium]MBU1970255.1 ribonuclease HI family protein [Patescibacteria group bacterium]
MIINTDGGARGNPGPGACGAVVKNRNGQVLREEGKYLGCCTNNEAEYHGLILGLQLAAEMQADQVEIIMDSELVVKQLQGTYRVKEPRLQALYVQAKKLEGQIGHVTYFAVPRAKNKQADSIVNRILDEQPHA